MSGRDARQGGNDLQRARKGHTLRNRATDAMDKILAARGDVVGVVFTRVDLPRYRKDNLSLATTK